MAYVVPERGKPLLPSALRTALKNRLPDYMIPRIVFLDALPLTDHGKIERARLPIPGHETYIDGRTCSAFEKQLLVIWERVLRITGIGPTDNFF